MDTEALSMTPCHVSLSKKKNGERVKVSTVCAVAIRETCLQLYV